MLPSYTRNLTLGTPDLHLLKTFREENIGKNPGKTNFPEAGVQGGTPEVFAWWR